MGTMTFADVVDAVREAVLEAQPTTEADAVEAAEEELSASIDRALIYTTDILALWDRGTHENVEADYLAGLAQMAAEQQALDLMALIAQSTAWQLADEWADAVYDGIDAAIREYIRDWGGPGDYGIDRDEALAVLFDADARGDVLASNPELAA